MTKSDFVKIVQPFSMTSTERIECLYDSLEYIRTNDIPGDFVECGVWKGGNILGVMEYFNTHNIIRNIWMYDTFQGMTTPQEIDTDLNGQMASEVMDEISCLSPLDEVKSNLDLSNYDKSLLKYIIGDVELTLNFSQNIPDKISILRLDTDWYSSTKKELQFLYPKLVKGGALIVDDYGHWKGCKLAVDEFQKVTPNFNFSKIDYTGIIHFKN